MPSRNTLSRPASSAPSGASGFRASLRSEVRTGAEAAPAVEQLSPHLSDSARLKQMLGKKMGVQEEAWFSPLSFSFSQGKENILSVKMPHPLFYRWFCLTGRSLLEKSARDMLGADLRIVYENSSARITQAARPPLTPADRKPVQEDRSHDPHFSDFITGGRNREALRLLRSALNGSPCTLFLLGASGTGKSLLLRAAKAELHQSRSDVLFFPCRELIALFQRSPALAHDMLTASSAVLIDDIQLLEKHTSLQQELAQILDSLEGHTFFLATYQTDELDGGGQKLHSALYDRLCSHLSLGLAEPDLDVRLRFTQEQMARVGLPEHHSTALFIARRCLRLRHIRGVLEQVRQSYEQNGKFPLQNELASMTGRAGAPQPPDVDHILAVVASRYGCSSAQLRENTREKSLILPRQIAMYLCRELLGESYPSLGLIFGGKDHSTIMYAVKKIGKMKVTNKDAHMQLTELTKQCLNSALRRETSV